MPIVMVINLKTYQTTCQGTITRKKLIYAS